MEYTLTVRQAERRRKNGLRAQKRRALGLPRYTLGEEVFSAVSHGVSALFAAGPTRWPFCKSTGPPEWCTVFPAAGRPPGKF